GMLLHRRAERFGARDLLNEIPGDDHDADSLSALAHVEIDLGEWRSARCLLERAQQTLTDDRAREAGTWHLPAAIDLKEGDYPAGGEKSGRPRETRQPISDRAGQEATWHQLASIDLREGDYPAARQKFVRSLEISQAIRDRPGEAATWHGLATTDLS